MNVRLAPSYQSEDLDNLADRIHRLADSSRESGEAVSVTTLLEKIKGEGDDSDRVTVEISAAAPLAVSGWVRSTEAAETLGVSRNTVKKWCRIGYLRGARRDADGWWRIPASAVASVAAVEADLSQMPDLGELDE